ncbi:MAG: cytochrome D1 domain-containing protein, partial [Pseudomonadales bacterium]
FGGGRGTRFRDPDMGPVWAVASMVSRDVQLFGTDPEGHPDQAWREVGTLRGPDSGSLFLASHPASKHLWMDTPLAADPESAQQVAVFDIGHLDKGFRRLPVARWAGLEGGPQRVLQPTYDASGSEVWLTVWNPQNLGAAVVVVDDATLEPRAVIRDAALTTPTRIYSVAALRRAVAPQTP